jgi:mannose-6-phosphate isomerase-like protein (cupin superfamily)
MIDLVFVRDANTTRITMLDRNHIVNAFASEASAQRSLVKAGIFLSTHTKMYATMRPINLAEKFSLFADYWSPRVIAEMNDYQFKLVKVEGEFVWHNHPDTDEVFIIIEGNLVIEFEDQSVSLAKGEMFVVPRGVNHKPVAASICQLMLVEPRGVVNTGEADSHLTAEQDAWI